MSCGKPARLDRPRPPLLLATGYYTCIAGSSIRQMPTFRSFHRSGSESDFGLHELGRTNAMSEHAGGGNPKSDKDQHPLLAPRQALLAKVLSSSSTAPLPTFEGEWDDEGVYFYQAFNDKIADWALEHQCLWVERTAATAASPRGSSPPCSPCCVLTPAPLSLTAAGPTSTPPG